MNPEKVLALFSEITLELLKGDQRRLYIWTDLIKRAKDAKGIQALQEKAADLLKASQEPNKENARGLMLQYLSDDSESASAVFENIIKARNEAAPLVFVNACINYGCLKKLEQNYAEARRSYTAAIKVCDKADAEVRDYCLPCLLHELADENISPAETSENTPSANDYLRMAGAQHPIAAYRLAQTKGISALKAKALLENAAKQGYAPAMYILASELINPSQIKEAKELLRTAKNLGNPRATNMLLEILTQEAAVGEHKEDALNDLIRVLKSEIQSGPDETYALYVAQYARLYLKDGEPYNRLNLREAYNTLICTITPTRNVYETAAARYWLACLLEKDYKNQTRALFHYNRAYDLAKDPKIKTEAEQAISRLVSDFEKLTDATKQSALKYYLRSARYLMASDEWQAHTEIAQLLVDNLELVFSPQAWSKLQDEKQTLILSILDRLDKPRKKPNSFFDALEKQPEKVAWLNAELSAQGDRELRDRSSQKTAEEILEEYKRNIFSSISETGTNPEAEIQSELESLTNLFFSQGRPRKLQFNDIYTVLEDPRLANSATAHFCLGRLKAQDDSKIQQGDRTHLRAQEVMYHYDRAHELGYLAEHGNNNAEQNLELLLKSFDDLRSEHIDFQYISKCVAFYLAQNWQRILANEWKPHPILLPTLARHGKELIASALTRLNKPAVLKAALDPESFLFKLIATARNGNDRAKLDAKRGTFARLFSATLEGNTEPLYPSVGIPADIIIDVLSHALRGDSPLHAPPFEASEIKALQNRLQRAHLVPIDIISTLANNHDDAATPEILRTLLNPDVISEEELKARIQHYIETAQAQINSSNWIVSDELEKVFATHKELFANALIPQGLPLIKNAFNPAHSLYRIFAIKREGGRPVPGRAELSGGVFANYFLASNSKLATQHPEKYQALMTDLAKYDHPLKTTDFTITQKEIAWLALEFRDFTQYRDVKALPIAGNHYSLYNAYAYVSAGAQAQVAQSVKASK